MNAICRRAVAIVLMAVFAIGLTTCKKEKIEVPSVKIFEGVITINYNKASVSAEVTDQGGAEVKSRGFVYSMTGGAMDTVYCGSGTGVYSAELNNLEPNTTYVYEAFAKNAGGTGTSGKVSFTTKSLPSYSIDVSANPSHGGIATGAGTFQEGQSCTVKATANTGFSFIKWTENDTQVSTNIEYTFNVTSNRNLVAHFSAHAYTIIATPDPENGGTISGFGGYNYGDQCTLTATANPGFTFDKWTEDDSQVSTNATYSFDVTGNRNLVAHFTLKTYTITAIAEPSEYGTVSISGNGQFHYSDQCTLTATPKPNYRFVNWTKNGTQVSTQATYPFEVTESAEYVAHFQLPYGDQIFTANGVSFTMKRIEGGTFWMGAQSTNSNGHNYDPDAYDDESPVHSVTLSTFYMGETEVTQALWQAVMGSNPSYFNGATQPVELVSWNTIVNQFIPALNTLTGCTFRLPTEAEWEYAAGGGNQSHGYKYAGSNMIGNVAWYYENSNNQTHPVGTILPNELGLYDMSGNAWEWCSDWYGNYSQGLQTNPQGPSSGSKRVLRGGSWNYGARYCRVSCRTTVTPGGATTAAGFRLVLSQ